MLLQSLNVTFFYTNAVFVGTQSFSGECKKHWQFSLS